MTQPAEWGAFGHGGVKLPMPPDVEGNTLLRDADPVIYTMLGYLPAVLDFHMGERLREEAEKIGIQIPNAVLATAAVEPVPAIYSDKVRFPFFTAYRKGEQQTGHTLVWDKSVGELEFAYVLPPMMPEPQIRLAPILRLVTRIVARALRQGFHPAYEAGAPVLLNAGMMSARLVSVRYEKYERMVAATGAGAESFCRAVVGTIEMVERDMPVREAFPEFDGANVTLDHVAGDGTSLTVTDVITKPLPTVTNVVPSSGTKAGGTSLTLLGEGFPVGQPVRVWVGSGEATSASVVNATTIQCVTRQQEAYPTFIADLVIQLMDGRRVRKAAAYTFTSP